MRSTAVLALALLVALTVAAGTSASPSRTMGALQLDATIPTLYRFDDAFCPPGTSTAVADCVRFVGQEEVPGLGRATTIYTKILGDDDVSCVVLNHNVAVIEVAGKGTISLARPGRLCGPPAPAVLPPSDFTVTGGTGTYAGASGTLTFENSVSALDGACRCGTGSDRWRGTLTVPGLDFDTTSPMLTGAVSKTVRAAKKAKQARVRFAISAQDLVDGPVPVECTARSGSSFPVGRTKVSCSATDTSGNTTTAQFTVTVKRART